MPPDDIHHILDRLLAKQIMHSACIDVLLHLIEELSQHAGVATFDGLPLREYFQKAKNEQLENILIGFEDRGSAVAAFVQNAVDEYRKETEE